MSWTQLNPDIKVKNTCKRFFNQYLYKAVVNLPGGRVIHDTTANTVEQILDRRKHEIQYNFSYSLTLSKHANMLLKALAQASVKNLEYYRSFKVSNDNNTIRVRIEEPSLCLYSNNEAALLELISNSPNSDTVVEIHRPQNELAKEILERGEIINKTPTTYQYKIFFRECRIETDRFRSVMALLKSMGDEVKLTSSVERNLSLRTIWFPGGYFYANDLKVLTFINLIDSNLISSFFKLTNIDE